MPVRPRSPDDAAARALDRPMPPQPHPYLARMARFTDGAEHDRRRADILAVLPPVAGLADAARARTEAAVAGLGRVDVVPLAKTVPIACLAAALGVPDVTADVAALCDDGTVSDRLPDLARTSILFQARDATAALVLLALADACPPEQAAPVLRTRREDGWVSLAAAPYGAGAHACPGRDHAVALASGMLAALAGYDVADRGPDEPRPNMHLPARLVLVRR